MVIFGLLIYQEFNPRLTQADQKKLFVAIGFMAICGYLESFLKLA